MEKFSVSQNNTPDDPKQKQSGGGPKCPICGSVAEKRGNAWFCPIHGTKPWEGKHESKSPR